MSTITVEQEVDLTDFKYEINNSYCPEELFDLDSIKEATKNSFHPNEVFSEKELEEWALDNGYVKDED